MLLKGFAISFIGLIVGCATVPDDAPQVFHEAQASLERLDEEDVDDYMPQSVERAQDDFTASLDMLDDARSDEPTYALSEAISRAQEAKNTADGAYNIYSKVQTWDSSPTAFQDALAALNRIEQGPVETEVAVIEPVSPFAKLRGAEIVSAVAFFDTGETEPYQRNNAEIESLASILAKDPNYKVQLTGYADPRGDEQKNQQLALNRAQTVARYLQEEKGISAAQISIESAGATSSETNLDQGRLQLDRKVEAKLVLEGSGT